MAVQHRILTLKFVLIGLLQPVTRIVDVSASLRMAELHELILPLFAWEDSASHRFIDHPIDEPRLGDDEYAGYARSATRRRVWEMEHWCRDTDGHVSECEWTSTVGAAFDSLPFGSSAVLYYEYGSTQCPEWRYGEPCLARQLDIADGRHRHGWTIAISVDAVRSARRAEPAALLRGTGRAPLVEAGGPAAYEEMLGVLTDPMHAKRPELCSWIEDRIGVWATSQPLARADFDVEATRVLIASTRRGASDHRDPSPFRALLARTERWAPRPPDRAPERRATCRSRDWRAPRPVAGCGIHVCGRSPPCGAVEHANGIGADRGGIGSGHVGPAVGFIRRCAPAAPVRLPAQRRPLAQSCRG